MYDIRNLNIWKQKPETGRRDSEALNMDVADLGLSVRSYNCLKRAGCHTVGDVIRLVESDERGLRRVRNLGSRSEAEILQAIEPFRNLHAAAPEPQVPGRILQRTAMRPKKSIWDADIEEFHLSDRALAGLKQSGIRQVRDLYATDPAHEPGWYAVRELLEKIPSMTAS